MFERLKTFALSINFLACLVTIFTFRLVIFGASVGDALALFAIGGAYSFKVFMASKKQPLVTEDLKREMDEIKNMIVMLKMKNNIKGTSEKPERYF